MSDKDVQDLAVIAGICRNAMDDIYAGRQHDALNRFAVALAKLEHLETIDLYARTAVERGIVTMKMAAIG